MSPTSQFMRRSSSAIALAAFVTVAAASDDDRTSTTLIVENLAAISEAGRAFVEPFVVTDPTNGNRLLVTVSQVEPTLGVIPRAFLSDDGGLTWRPSELADLRAAVAAGRLNGFEDMWAAIGARGTMYISTLGIADPARAKREAAAWSTMPVLVLRSENSGARWSLPTVIRTRSSDAPKMAVWQDSVVVVAAQLNGGDSVARVPNEVSEYIAVYRSTDGARTFDQPRFLAPDDLGHNPLNPLFLRDGTLLVGWMDHPHWSQHGPEQSTTDSRIFVARSTDLGRTFAIPHVVADVQRSGFPAVLRMILDESPSSSHRGRVYVVWNGGHDVHSDVSIAHSDDGGKHWSAPRHVTSSGADVFTAATTNRDGALALVWGHHETDATATPCYTLYVAASTNGGDSFTSPKPLTDAMICPDVPGNRGIVYPFFGRQDTVSSSWRHGGDYIGLAATADGAFHPVWTDTRDGPFRVYTARVRLQ